ncbi:MAG: hypothetical protein IJT41_01030 [Clostridia bacterium]|nr:hypothetical protein [Clostridia bacterium]
MKAYRWILCIILVGVIGFCFIRFGNFQSDESTLQRSAENETITEAAEAATEFTFDADAFNNRLLTVINAYRARFSAPAWTTDTKLTDAAILRAKECSYLASKSHTRPDGSEWFTVLGITENFNYSEITGISGLSPDDLLRSWVSSEAINSGLISTEYTACGIGCEAIGNDVYCVLILYKP